MATLPLEGSSRTTGGTSRGRAIGNQPNIADTDEEDTTSFQKPLNGIIRYCNHTSISPPFNKEDVEFGFIHKVHKERTVCSLLRELGKLFESIQCKSNPFLDKYLLKIYLDQTLFLWDNELDAWAIQGSYIQAITNRSQAEFINDENDRPTFWILGVSDFF